jgi:hypothetical protein
MYACFHTMDVQQGNTALLAAAFSGKAVFLRMLLDAGANKDAKNQVCRCEYVYCIDARVFLNYFCCCCCSF